MNISELQQKFYAELSAVSNAGQLEELRNEYLGRKRGVITALLKDLPGLPPEDRKSAGSMINEFKKLVETELERKKAELESPGKIQPVDWTLPGQEFRLGAIHPITLVRQ